MTAINAAPPTGEASDTSPAKHSTKLIGKRRKAREVALKALYQADTRAEDADAHLAVFWAEREEDAETVAFARRLAEGVWAARATIDALITAASPNWRLDRMALVDKCVLRLAAYELFACAEIPPRVSFDEAIELARRYGAEDSPAFVNGVLDALVALVLQLVM